MIWGFLLTCLLRLAQPCRAVESEKEVFEDVVKGGWEDYTLANVEGTVVKNMRYPGISLTHPELRGIPFGSLTMTGRPELEELGKANEYTIEIVHENAIFRYGYKLDSGEKGHVKVTSTSRTYSMTLLARMINADEVPFCYTKVTFNKLLKEGPVNITTRGENSKEAQKLTEKIRIYLVLQTRAIAHFEIVENMQNSLNKRRPNVCQGT